MTSQTDVRSALAAANEAFMTAFSRGDAGAVATLYTESGQMLPPNSDPVTGKTALQGLFQGLMDMGIKGIKLEAVEAEAYGDTAVEVGRYTLKGEEDQVLDQGKYIVIWKQEAGQWKLHRDIFNSSLPVPE